MSMPRRMGVPRRVTRSGGRAVVGTLLVAVVAGALAGVLWWALWSPPLGVALQGEFVYTSGGLPGAFDGTAIYALVAAGLGLLLGLAVALRSDGRELAGLVLVAAATAVAAAVMAVTGGLLGPPDADAEARGQADYTAVEGDLHVDGVGAYLAAPIFGLLGAGGVFLGLAARGRQASGHDSAASPSEEVAAG